MIEMKTKAGNLVIPIRSRGALAVKWPAAERAGAWLEFTSISDDKYTLPQHDLPDSGGWVRLPYTSFVRLMEAATGRPAKVGKFRIIFPVERG